MEWISIKKKKPKKGDVVDIWGKNSKRLIGYRYIGKGEFEVGKSGPCWMDDKCKFDPVTHWMPQPEPPKD